MGVDVQQLGYPPPTDAELLNWATNQVAPPITFPLLCDPTGANIQWKYAPSGLPTIFIIGADKIIDYKQPGEVSESDLDGHIQDALHTRTAVDLEMVMDVSATMTDPPPGGGNAKVDLMKQAADIIVDHLAVNGQTGDRMGLVWFTDNASEHIDQLSGEKLLPVKTQADSLKSAIDIHSTGICTAMGAGLQMAFNTLSGSANKKFVILLTDGMQNVQPKVEKTSSGDYQIFDTGGGWICTGPANVQGSPGTNIKDCGVKVHTIGVGITANYEPTLRDIANQTGGFYRSV